MEDVCRWCGRGLPPENYQGARVLIEDLLLEWDAIPLRQNNPGLGTVVEEMRRWLNEQPPHPNVIG
jgi:hypothetical protein